MKLLINSHFFNTGVSYHRIKPLYKLDIDFAVYDNWEDTEKIDIKNYDFLMFNTHATLNGGVDKHLEIFNQVKEAGLKIVVDIDDYWEVPEHHPMRFHGDEQYLNRKELMLQNIKYGDIFWCATPELCDHVKKLRPDADVWLVRNAVDYAEDQWLSSSSHIWNVKDKVKISFIGGRTHYKDYNPLLSPMTTLWSRHKDKLWVNLMGVSQNNKDSVRCWRNISNNLTANGKYKNVKYWKLATSSTYGFFYDFTDISLASVLDNEFNRCKSELKVVEAGAKWTPIICSDVVTYNRVGLTELKLASSPEEWVYYIEELLDPVKRKEYGNILGQFVREEYSQQKENEIRLNSLR